MTEYYTVKRIDNSRLFAAPAPSRVRDLWRECARVARALAACLLVYTWQHFECIQLRYQVEQLESQRAQVGAAESAIASGSGGAAFAHARGFDCEKSIGIDGSGAGPGGPGGCFKPTPWWRRHAPRFQTPRP